MLIYKYDNVTEKIWFFYWLKSCSEIILCCKLTPVSLTFRPNSIVLLCNMEIIFMKVFFFVWHFGISLFIFFYYFVHNLIEWKNMSTWIGVRGSPGVPVCLSVCSHFHTLAMPKRVDQSSSAHQLKIY